MSFLTPTVSDGEDGSYHDNTMHFVSDSSASVQFEYDKNGNLVKDLNKNISSIQYNCLNLPSQIDIASTGHLMFLYGASGSKQKTIHVVRQPNGSYHTTTVDYSGNFLYENNVLKKILIDGGYVTFSGTTPIYHFYLQDHQGNNCVVVNSKGTVEQVNHYYPYGALFVLRIRLEKKKRNQSEGIIVI